MDLEKVVISLYVCPSRHQARTAYSTAYDEIFAFIDYAGAVPAATRILPGRLRYDVTTAVPLAPLLCVFAVSFFGGEKASFTGMTTIPNNAVYDGVIVRCPWDWEKTVGTTRMGKFARTWPTGEGL